MPGEGMAWASTGVPGEYDNARGVVVTEPAPIVAEVNW
jgi:hypothetical protein